MSKLTVVNQRRGVYYSVMNTRNSGIQTDRIEKHMQELGLDNKALAKAVGVSEAAISKLLNGKSPGMSAVNIKKIADVLRVSVDYLMGLTEDPLPKSISSDQKILDFVRVVGGLSDFRRRDLLRIANGYAEDDQKTIEQTLDDIRDLVFRAADKMGRGEELNQFLEGRIKALLEDGGDLLPDDEGGDDSSGEDEGNEDDNADRGDEPRDE